jgi:hypothetical protein
MLVGAIALLAYKSDVLVNMFSARESDNALKLVHMRDYMSLFGEWPILFFGQGLGAKFHSTLYGYTSITELTYFDILRSYGFAGAFAIGCLLLYPLATLRDADRRDSHFICIAYGLYLILCVSNPMLFSSDGMLVLALVISICWRRRLDPAAQQWNLRHAI